MSAITEIAEISGMAGVMIVAAIVPNVEIPEYMHFFNGMEVFFDAVIKAAGAVAAVLLLRKLWLGNKSAEWNLMNEKKKAQEEGLKGSIDELIQTLKDKDK